MTQAAAMRWQAVALAVAVLGGCRNPAPASATAAGSAEVASQAARPLAEQAAADAAALTAPAAPTPLPPLAAGISVDGNAFNDSLTGLHLPAPAGMQWHRDFHPQYLTPTGWAMFAPAGQAGTPLAALLLDGSNEVTAAELRVGRSDDPQAVATCLQPPAEAQGAPEPVVLDGVDFIHFHSADAAMSHYLQVDGYRGMRHGQCVAIDLIVSGTRPEVYDPPRLPPFAVDAATARLREALRGLSWTSPGATALVR
ncbi:MAG TPA: hypothetical protein VD865_02435 [Stenotrophomonas sp.]|nr:hypothetical protein [Stenotrophomonas sp.]